MIQRSVTTGNVLPVLPIVPVVPIVVTVRRCMILLGLIVWKYEQLPVCHIDAFVRITTSSRRSERSPFVIPFVTTTTTTTTTTTALYSSMAFRPGNTDPHPIRCSTATVWTPLQSWNHVGCHYKSIIQMKQQQPKQQQPEIPKTILPVKNPPILNINSDLSSQSQQQHQQQQQQQRQQTAPLVALSSIRPIPRSFTLQRSAFFLPAHQRQQQQQQHGRRRSSTGSSSTGSATTGSTSSPVAAHFVTATTTTKKYALSSLSSSSSAYENNYSNNGLSPCNIKVIGVGGGGCNAIDRMLETTIGRNTPSTTTTATPPPPPPPPPPPLPKNEIDYWALNTDSQVINRSKLRGANTIQIGTSVTRGLGAGGNPDVGRMAAEESRQDIRHMIDNCDLCFITAGMGGGTGSGAAPVVARVAKEMGCLTIGIVTKPFAFEGKRRMTQALNAMEELRKHVDTIIVVSNDRLLEIIPDDTPLDRAFCVADDILRQGVIGITDIILQPGLINVDFADVRTIMSNAGTALMGIGIGSGENAAEDAAMAAISSPLLDATIDNAKGVVFNVSGGPKLTLQQVNQAAKLIYKFVSPDANVIFGALVDESLGDHVSITVLAAGFDDEPILNNSSNNNNNENNNITPIAMDTMNSNNNNDIWNDTINTPNTAIGMDNSNTNINNNNNSLPNFFRGPD